MLAPCRAVGVAIILCFSGVALITQPRFLGFPDTGRVTALGTFFALFQVSCYDQAWHPGPSSDSWAGASLGSAQKRLTVTVLSPMLHCKHQAVAGSSGMSMARRVQE